MVKELLPFASDYMQGAHPAIIKRLSEINSTAFPGYGTDDICEQAKQKILQACDCPNGKVYFLVGGTQTNATVIDALLHSYDGVIAADTGHINTHEAGAIEFGGHKVLTLPHKLGKIAPTDLAAYLNTFAHDGNRDHMVQPGMVYISQPSEYGTIYSLDELTALHNICQQYQIPLFVDGARLAYALACPENDVTLADLARLTDAFYIGGTKCGTLFGEAVVIPRPHTIPHFFTIIKQHGALLAKGWLLGVQFDTLFTDDLYLKIGQDAIKYANEIRAALAKSSYQQDLIAPTNQIYVIVPNDKLTAIGQKTAYGFWDKYDDTHTTIRLATSWYTTAADTKALIELFK